MRQMWKTHKLFVANVHHYGDIGKCDWLNTLVDDWTNWNRWHRTVFDESATICPYNRQCFALIPTKINKAFQLLRIIRDLADISWSIDCCTRSNVHLRLNYWCGRRSKIDEEREENGAKQPSSCHRVCASFACTFCCFESLNGFNSTLLYGPMASIWLDAVISSALSLRKHDLNEWMQYNKHDAISKINIHILFSEIWITSLWFGNA